MVLCTRHGVLKMEGALPHLEAWQKEFFKMYARGCSRFNILSQFCADVFWNLILLTIPGTNRHCGLLLEVGSTPMSVLSNLGLWGFIDVLKQNLKRRLATLRLISGKLWNIRFWGTFSYILETVWGNRNRKFWENLQIFENCEKI